MKKYIFRIIVLLIMLPVYNVSRADEGMWLINLLDKNLTKKMQKAGLKIDPKVIYDENNVSISDAVVALDFGCTGSIISADGLLITNHHCAYSDIHALSTPEHNYLEDGFWAMNRTQEIYIPGKSVFFLRKVMDVTEEVKDIADSLRKAGFNAGMRKISSIIEPRHAKSSGYETMCMPMWRGSEYYMFYYEVYTDIRLVGAPPVSIAAFGGETDNWEWPQHKGDFALYRVYGGKDGKPAKYSAENVPVTPKKVLPISLKGVREGEFTMILGFPGRTNRYNNSFAVNEKEKITNPVSVSVKRERLDIMDKWMNADPDIRLKYADLYFSISNVQELQQGEVYNFRRYGVVKVLEEQEKELQAWIMGDPERARRWGDLLDKLSKCYKGTGDIARNLQYFRETLVSGTGFIFLGNRSKSLANKGDKIDSDSLIIGSTLYKNYVSVIMKGYEQCDMRVERDLLNYQLKLFMEKVDRRYWGDYITELDQKFKGDYQAIADYIYENSLLMHPERFMEAIKSNQPLTLFTHDPVALLCGSTGMQPFNAATSEVTGKDDISTLEAYYTRALYQMRKEKNIVQYPDANSTMRLTYGTVGPINPSDGIYYSCQSTTQGLWDKYNPDDYEFTMKPRMMELLESRDWGEYGEKGRMYVDFLTNNDITGGNSGSPIMNAKGEIIGLAFDGNKESLASDVYFHPEYNKCVNVDIRYILWIIDKYAGAGYLIKEMNIVR
jgi:hypothetical protein